MEVKKQFAITMIAMFILFSQLNAQQTNVPTTREMNLLTWTEFDEFVPEQIETVLLPTGSIEPHGVIPSGSDNLAPQAMAREIAKRVNAFIAPTLNYGVTPRMQAYPGAVSISETSYAPFVKEVITGLAKNNFKNIIVINGHGGNTNSLNSVVNEISDKYKVRILVISWWSFTSEETFAIFDENGGHAGNNETAYIQAIVPEHIHPERYSKEMAIPLPVANSYYAVPVPSSILLYEKGQGYPTFDQNQANDYFKRVNNRVAELIEEVIRKWDLAGLYR
jgi:creatinine amidohydrolase